jgi:hypothetical protein
MIFINYIVIYSKNYIHVKKPVKKQAYALIFKGELPSKTSGICLFSKVEMVVVLPKEWSPLETTYVTCFLG